MKTLLTSASLIALLGASSLTFAALDSEQQKLSYSLGATLGQSIHQDVDDLDIDSFTQAIQDVFAGEELALSDEEMAKTLTDFQQEAMRNRAAQAEAEAEANAADSQAFLDENAEKEGVTITESGLQYRVLESGDGATPKAGDSVEVHYEGTLTDGTVFDSSYERGEPVQFKVGQVIEGWQEALKLMSEGDTWELVIPSELAYGESGQGPIGPNEVLVFKVELLGVDAADKK